MLNEVCHGYTPKVRGVRPRLTTPDDSMPRREQILTEAVRLFNELGYGEASVRDIATALGIRAPSLYNHFRSKQELLVEICTRVQSSINRTVLPELRQSSAPPDNIASAIRALILHNYAHRADVLVMARERRHLPRERLTHVNRLRRELRDAFVDAIEEGVKTGRLNVEEPKLAASAILDMVNGLWEWFNPSDAQDLDRVGHLYAAAALSLLEHWPPSH